MWYDPFQIISLWVPCGSGGGANSANAVDKENFNLPNAVPLRSAERNGPSIRRSSKGDPRGGGAN